MCQTRSSCCSSLRSAKAGFPPAITYQKALKDAGIPWTSFACDDVQKEYERMTALGVTFKQPPAKMGPVTLAVLDDTCGNLIQIVQRGYVPLAPPLHCEGIGPMLGLSRGNRMSD